MSLRKIIHVDCDCFYAAIEMRDDPRLAGRPMAVGGSTDRRGVIATCNYEARAYGVRSAMSSRHALKLCPDLLIVKPRFEAYREASREIHTIFRDYTELIEPLSLDEAYLDVTEPKSGIELATDIARTIRAQIREETNLTASAGIAPNKFLAKIASDWRKPDGQFVIPPQRVDAFLAPLPVNRVPGVGKVMEGKLAARGIATCGDLRQWALIDLEEAFGSFGRSLYNRARGIDERPVEPDQQVQSISSEDTFAEDLLLEDLTEAIVQLAGKTWNATRKTERIGHTVVLKLKTAQFRILTRSFTPERPPESMEELRDIALALRARVDLPAETRYRLVGVGLGGFREKEPVVQGELFEHDMINPTDT